MITTLAEAEGLRGHAESIRVRCDRCLRRREVVQNLKEYHPPLGGRDGLRLDFNENVGGLFAARARYDV